MKKEKHCEKCSYMTEEGLVISGCAYCGCHQKKTEEWEKELENPLNTADIHMLKDFIRQLLSQERLKLLREIEEMLPKERIPEVRRLGIYRGGEEVVMDSCCDVTFNRCLAQIKQLIEKLK